MNNASLNKNHKKNKAHPSHIFLDQLISMRSTFYFVLLFSCMESAESGLCREVGCDNYLFSDDTQCDPCTEQTCCALQTCAEAKSMGCFDEIPTGVVTCESQLCGPEECCVEPGTCDVDYASGCPEGSVPIVDGICDSIQCEFDDCCEDISVTCENTFPPPRECGLQQLTFFSGTCTGPGGQCLDTDCCIPDTGCFHTQEETLEGCPKKVRTSLSILSSVYNTVYCCLEETCSGFGAPNSCPSGTERNENLVCGGLGGIDCTVETCCSAETGGEKSGTCAFDFASGCPGNSMLLLGGTCADIPCELHECCVDVTGTGEFGGGF